MRYLAVRLIGCVSIAGFVFVSQALASETSPDPQTDIGEHQLLAPEHVTIWWQQFVAGPWGGFPEGACLGSKGRHRTDAFDFTSGTDCGASGGQLVSLRTVGKCNPCTSLSRHAVLAVFVVFKVPASGCDIAELGTLDYSNKQHGTYRALHVEGSDGLSHDVYAGNPIQRTDWGFAYTFQEDVGCTGFSGQHVHQDGKDASLYGDGEGIHHCWPVQNGPGYTGPIPITDVWDFIDDWVHIWEYDRGVVGLTNNGSGSQPICNPAP